MRHVITITAVLAAAAIGYLLGHRSRAPSGPSSDDGPVIATVAGESVRLGALEARLKAQPELRLSTQEARRQFLEGLIRIDLLARKAREKGYDQDPDFLRRYNQEIGSLYLIKEFEEPERKIAPTNDEVRKYFDDHLAESSRAERARIAIIAFFAEDAAARSLKRSLAQSVLADVKRRANDYYAFGTVARFKSEEPVSRATNGELPFLDKTALSTRFGREVGEVSFSMSTPDLHRQVVETEKGFFLVKLLGKAPAYQPKFEEVGDTIRARLTTERREKDLKAFMDRLWNEANVRIDDEALGKLKL
jgi:peptidyl-prolyl cis-trans isomerase C